MEVVTGKRVGCGTEKKITEWGRQYVGFGKFKFGNRSLHECVIFCSIPLLCVNIEMETVVVLGNVIQGQGEVITNMCEMVSEVVEPRI